MDKQQFLQPALSYRPASMWHTPGDQPDAALNAIATAGYRGVVTNVPFTDGFTANPENIACLADFLRRIQEKQLSYWLYDESRYPSGRAGGLTLEGHPEYAAKGVYMHRRVAFEPTHAVFRLDDESDKIVWAAKYPFDTPGNSKSVICYDRMQPVIFTAERLECDLAEKEVLFVFCVKDAYAGSHSTHNCASFQKNINILDHRAVRRFIEVAYEPILQAIPDAYAGAGNVFTDEPSLQTGYVCENETWQYALAPWVDGLFEAYEAAYGESLLPHLPLLFEGGAEAYPVRVNFYTLIGKLIAEAYTGQLTAWCTAHGTGFSGHYLGEETMVQQVMQYGDYIRVLQEATMPGLDVLSCYPEIFNINTVKFPQIAARKNGTGMMVEICPFDNREVFLQHPFENLTAVTGALYLGGVRVVNSYFRHEDTVRMQQLNTYTARLGVMLDGLVSDTDIFVYYGIENVQAKQKPLYCSGWTTGDTTADAATAALVNTITDCGFDFYYADAADLQAAAAVKDGQPCISGLPVKTVLIPAMDVVRQETLTALATLKAAGVRICFMDQLPLYAAETGKEPVFSCDFDVADLAAVRQELSARGGVFCTQTASNVLHARFRSGNTLRHMLCNMSRAAVTLPYTETHDATVYDPLDGSILPLKAGATLTVPALQAIFVDI